MRIRLDGNRRGEIDPRTFRHLEYAVTSPASQGQTVDRVLVNADTRESSLLLNRRMAFVAVSRVRESVVIFTDDRDRLADALSRRMDKSQAIAEFATRFRPDEHRQTQSDDRTIRRSR